ncbi:MAG: hypothetical protein QGI61_01720 [Alphaproteobacteria bacterium]|jgi:hypothetical protein|nr:hypothetical protein [Alphaproteobacteria bacterium]|tara:strand:- start:107 stop:337 length:231 start_codon:yes stop_codon:yes gene_type:complete
MKKWITALAGNSYLNLFLGVVVALTGLMEVGETLQHDFVNGKIRSGHGVVLIGVWHLVRSVADLLDAADYFKDGLE